MITAASKKTPAALREYSLRELGDLAKRIGLDDWRSMSKDKLVQALARALKRQGQASKAKPKAGGKATKAKAGKSTPKTKSSKKAVSKNVASKKQAGKTAKSARTPSAKSTKRIVAKSNVRAAKGEKSKGKASAKLKTQAKAKATQSKTKAKAKAKAKPAKKVNPRALRRIQAMNEMRDSRMDLAHPNGNGKHGRSVERDRIVLLVRDAYWLQACWDLTRQSIDRARAAMAEAWHTSQPVLRVVEVDSGTTTSAAERVVRDIPIHGGVRNWYIDVANPPHSFRVEIGYLSSGGRFYSLARSNTVTTPVPGAADGLDGHWTDVAQDYERIYALSGGYSDEHSSGDLQELFEERLRRPMGSPVATRYGGGAERILNRQREFEFEVDAEMIIFGRTKPGAHVTLGGEPVKLRDDGAFAVRLGLPDRRQVLPIVASTSDGVEQRTIVLAVERNTKVMEPVVRESTE